MLFRKKILPFLLITLLFSCKNKEDNNATTTFIRGQIINPTLDYVIFSKGNEVLDTIKLDSKNFFEYKTEKFQAGLYSFKHSETQVFFIEPGDSLLMHVNTVDFDESLAYSGKGASQNNLLMDLYLKNETENLNLPKWYALSSVEFEKKIDSLKAIKLNEYETFRKENDVDEEFKKIALANIRYDYYSKKELYASANRNNPEKFDGSFFDYRKDIDFNRNELSFYYPYYRFMNRYFTNRACDEFNGNPKIDRYSFDYNYKKIHIIDSTVTEDTLKNSLLRYNAISYLLNAKNAEEEKKYFEAFAAINTDKKHIEEVATLMEATVKLTAGNTLPHVLVVNSSNVVNNLKNIVKAPTVIYFWSIQTTEQSKNIHTRAAELKSKYPEYNFIGINTDTHFKKWRQAITKLEYNPALEFQLENVEDAEKKLVLNSMNKVFIVDENTVILEGRTNMFDLNFEELLLGFLNR